MYSREPWTLSNNNEVLKKKSSLRKDSKSSQNKKNPFFVENAAVSTARVLQLFEDNKSKIYTNKEIAEELNLSEGTITSITTRLEGLKKIKIVEILQRVSAYTVMYQHIDGPAQRVNKRRGIKGDQKDISQLVFDLFEKNKNRVYTKKSIKESLGSEHEGQIIESLKILLLSQNIKIVGNGEYQHFKGNLGGDVVFKRHDNRFITLDEFLVKNNAQHDRAYFQKELLKKDYKLFYSSRKIVKEYLISDLEKILKNSKGILRRILYHG